MITSVVSYRVIGELDKAVRSEPQEVQGMREIALSDTRCCVELVGKQPSPHSSVGTSSSCDRALQLKRKGFPKS